VLGLCTVGRVEVHNDDWVLRQSVLEVLLAKQTSVIGRCCLQRSLGRFTFGCCAPSCLNWEIMCWICGDESVGSWCARWSRLDPSQGRTVELGDFTCECEVKTQRT
jgi:hypothetical protein